MSWSPSGHERSRRPFGLSADCLPLRSGAVDAAMSVLSVHHWDHGQERGIREMRRVATGPVVILTCDPKVSSAMWLMADYLPEVAELDRRVFPDLKRLSTWLGGQTRVEIVPVPHDCCDWMLMSFWAHPERVLDASSRNATSGFARMASSIVDRVTAAVRRDLEQGVWDARYGNLRNLDAFDAGLRLVVNTPDPRRRGPGAAAPGRSPQPR